MLDMYLKNVQHVSKKIFNLCTANVQRAFLESQHVFEKYKRKPIKPVERSTKKGQKTWTKN